jgi:DNA ligase 1
MSTSALPFIPFESILMHGHDWGGQDVRGWHITEKLDGCRARWDGRTLLSRGGHPIDAPLALLNPLPSNLSLDIEVYAGYRRREVARQAVQYGRWGTGVELVVFDAPHFPADWRQRREWASRHAGLPMVAHFGEVTTLEALADLLATVQRAGGEGLMLSRPGRPYAERRTPDLLKLKRLDTLREHISEVAAA